MTGFERIENRYVLECVLENTAAIHIGTGVATPDTDAPFIRRAGVPFIPGSSLRGVLRSTVERLVTALGYPVCVTFSGEEGPEDGCAAGNKKLRKKYDALDGRTFLADLASGSAKLCPVCRLFGCTLMAARLKVSDAVPAGAQVPVPVKRDSVGIDRDTETAHPGAKYDFEVLEPGCSFKFVLELENAADTDLALLYIALKEMQRGIDVGGKKARGLGRVRLTGVSASYFDRTVHPAGRLLGPLADCPDVNNRLQQAFQRVFPGG